MNTRPLQVGYVVFWSFVLVAMSIFVIYGAAQ